MISPANPHADCIGWCHQCETLQWGADARYLPMWWNLNEPDWACVNCDGEPWGMGVWTRGTASEVDRDSSLGVKITAGANIYDLTDAESALLTRR